MLTILQLQTSSISRFFCSKEMAGSTARASKPPCKSRQPASEDQQAKQAKTSGRIGINMSQPQVDNDFAADLGNSAT